MAFGAASLLTTVVLAEFCPLVALCSVLRMLRTPASWYRLDVENCRHVRLFVPCPRRSLPGWRLPKSPQPWLPIWNEMPQRMEAPWWYSLACRRPRSSAGSSLITNFCRTTINHSATATTCSFPYRPQAISKVRRLATVP